MLTYFLKLYYYPRRNDEADDRTSRRPKREELLESLKQLLLLDVNLELRSESPNWRWSETLIHLDSWGKGAWGNGAMGQWSNVNLNR
jgi:hypothetical protein